MTTLCEAAFPNGTFVRGKWNGGKYRVERLLGEGANGKVYLVSRGKSLYALKIGYDALDHQSEVNVLKSLARRSASFRGFLVDADDFLWNGETVPFYVMKYVKGQTLPEFLKKREPDWLYVIGLHLLGKLNELHRHGWAFGDLKADNVMVTGYGGVELVDFGGVTPMGKSIRQFTEVYDRGCWNAGTRVADEGYDLFAFAVLCIQMAKYRGSAAAYAQLLPQNRRIEFLLDEIKETPQLGRVSHVLVKALRGQYRSSAEALREWRELSIDAPHRASPAGLPLPWLKYCFAASLLLFVATLVFFWWQGN
mgnify:CR=1 FL=1